MKKIKIPLILFILILLISIGASFAYFSAVITGSETNATITVSGGTMNITYSGGSNITVSNIYPRSEAWATKEFTVTGNNTTTQNMAYDLSLVTVSNGFSENAISIKLTSENPGGNGTTTNLLSGISISKGTSTTKLGTGVFEGFTNGNKIHKYYLSVYFYEKNENQNLDRGKTFSAYVKIESTNYTNFYQSTQDGKSLEFANTLNTAPIISINGITYQANEGTPLNPYPLINSNNFDLISSKGSRNYLLNSEKLTTDGGVAPGLTKQINAEGNLVITAASGNGNYVSNFGLTPSNTNIHSNINIGDKITFSIKIRSSDSTKNPSLHFGEGMSYVMLLGNVSSNWSTIYYTGTWNTSDWKPHLGFSGITGTFEFKEAKLELGGKYTEWTPAPEDIPYNTLTKGVYKTKINLDNSLKSSALEYDRVFKDTDNIWKVSRNIKEVTGSALTVDTVIASTGNNYYFNNTIAFILYGNDLSNMDNISPVISSHFINNNWVNNYNSQSSITNTIMKIKDEGTKRLFIRVDESLIDINPSMTITEIRNKMKNWLNLNNPVMHIKTETPTIENLNSTYQTNLNNLPAFQGRTYIYTVGDYIPNLKATMSIKSI